MFDSGWLIRMSHWLRHPPSPKRVRLVLAVVAICLTIVALEHFGLWPASWTLSRRPGIPLR